jgi:hypothetical protein
LTLSPKHLLESVEGDIARDSRLFEASEVRFSVLQVKKICCGLEFVVGDCREHSLLDSYRMLSWSAE